MRPSSSDDIDRARPGLMAVALRDAHIDRKVGAARRRAADFARQLHRHLAGTHDSTPHRFAHGQFLATREPRIFRKCGDGRGERTGEIEEKRVFTAMYSSNNLCIITRSYAA